jgi:hypothetical protein
MYINGFFISVFDLTTDLTFSEGHTSHFIQGCIQIDLRFAEALPDPVTWLMYLKFDNTVQIDSLKRVYTDF